jgi:hypothetical protein
MVRLLVIALVTLCAAPIFAQVNATKSKNTVPVPPKVQPVDPLRIFPAIQMPINPDNYVWEVTSAGETAVPVFRLDRGRRQMIGNVPVGQELTLTRMTRFGDRLYYAFYWDGSNFTADRTPTIVYLDGRYIKAKALKKS